MMITSVTNEFVKEIQKLHQKKYRDETGTFFVEGRHMVMEAIASGFCTEIITTDPDFNEFSKVTLVSDAVMKKISDVDTPPGIMAICKMRPVNVGNTKMLLLDGIADPGNMGTLLRTALAFGFTNVIVDDCVDVTNPKVLRSTQGAIFHLNILNAPLTDFIKEHPDYSFFGTDLHGGIPLSSLRSIPQKLGLILGNEANGIRPEVLSLTTKNLFIEISQIESLNVAVAGGILMHILK